MVILGYLVRTNSFKQNLIIDTLAYVESLSIDLGVMHLRKIDVIKKNYFFHVVYCNGTNKSELTMMCVKK